MEKLYVWFPNPMGIVTGRVTAEFVRTKQIKRMVVYGGVDIVPVALCMLAVPADPWYVLSVTPTTDD